MTGMIFVNDNCYAFIVLLYAVWNIARLLTSK